mgnify:CR=1 FL=1
MTDYNPHNYVAIMVHICDTFSLTHPQMMALRAKVERIFHGQPVAFSKRSTPVTLNAVAITVGLAVGFGGYEAAMETSEQALLKRARDYDPSESLSKTERRAMQQRARKLLRGSLRA